MAKRIVEVTEETFESEVLQSLLPVLVDFWAPWCGPCQLVAPGLAEIATIYDGRAKVVKVNTDRNGGLARRYGIQGIPAVMLVRGGEVMNTAVGIRPKEEYMRLLDGVLSEPPDTSPDKPNASLRSPTPSS